LWIRERKLKNGIGPDDETLDERIGYYGDKAGYISGENICIDGGMTKQMIYHGEHGWKCEE
jgi:hypothetical protein